VVRLELGLRMLYLISQCRRRSGGRCRRRAKTSSYLVPVPPSCASMVGLFVLPVATTRPAACDMCTFNLTSPSVLVEAQLFHSYKQSSQRPCMRRSSDGHDPWTVTFGPALRYSLVHSSPAKGSQWTHGAVRFTLLRLTLESTRVVGMKSCSRVQLSRENQ
jgi:hypothetical protein